MARKAKIGAGIALDGEKEFKAAITGINKDLNVLKTALEKNKSEFDANGKSTNALNDKLKILSKQYETQKSKVEAVKSALENSQKNYADCGKKVEELKSALDSAEKEMDDMKKSSSTSTEALDKQKNKIEDLKESLNKAETSYQKADNKTKDWQSSLNKAESDLLKTKKTIDDTEEELRDFSASADKAGKKAKEAGNKAEKSSHDWSKLSSKIGDATVAMGKVVIKATAVAGAALVGLGGAAIKVGIDFESAFAGVKKTVDATPEQLEQIRTSLLNLSKQIPLTATDIAGIAEAAGQLGIKTESIEKFTRVMADMGVATNLTSEDAATSLARLANITGMSQENFDRLGSVIVALGNNLATTESEIVEMGLRLAGAGKQIGLSESQIMSFAGALSSVGIEAEAGGSAFSKVMVNMQLACETGNDSLKDFANVAGMSAQEFKTSFEEDASGAILKFIEGLSKCDEKGISAIKVLDDMGITEVRLRDSLLRASGASEVFSESLRLGTTAWEENNALTKEAEQRYETTESKLILLKNSFSALGTEIYDSVNTPIRTVIESATDMAEQLTGAFKKGGLSSLVSEFGTVFADVVVKAAENAPKMIDVAVDMIQSFLVGIQRNSKKIADAAVKIGKSLIDGMIKIIPQLAKVGVDIISALTSSLLGSEVARSVKKLGDTIIKSFKEIFKAVKSVFDALKPVFSTFVSTVANIASAVLPILTKAFTGLTQVIKPLIPILVAAVGAFVGFKIAQTLSSMIDKLAGTIGLVKKAQELWNIAMSSNPIGAVITAVGVFAGAIGGLLIALGGESAERRKLYEEIEKETTARQENYDQAARDYAEKDREIGKIVELKREMDNLVDANGKIKEGYENRVAFVANELAQSSGTEIKIVDGVVQSYEELTRVVEISTWKRRLSGLMDSFSKIRETAETELPKARDELDRLKENYKKNWDDLITINSDGKEIWKASGEEVTDEFKRSRDEDFKIIQEKIRVRDDYLTDIENYNYLETMSTKGTTEEIMEAVTRLSLTYDSEGKKIDSNSKDRFNKLQKDKNDFNDRWLNSEDEFNKKKSKTALNGVESEESILRNSLIKQVSLIDSNGEVFQVSFENLMSHAKNGLKNKEAEVNLAMTDNMESIIAAINNSSLPVEQKTAALMDLQKQMIDGKSPEVVEAQKSSLRSVLQAIADKNPEMAATMQALIKEGLIATDEEMSKLPQIAEEHAGEISPRMQSAIDGGKEEVVQSVAQVNTDVETTLKSLGTVGDQTGALLTQNTANSINNNSGFVTSATKNLTLTSANEIGKMPNLFGQYGSASVSDLTKNLKDEDPKKQVGNISSAMDRALAPIVGILKQYGLDAANGVSAGFNSGMPNARNIFASAASSLASIVKTTWGINSPSKVFAKISESIPEGIGVGIKRKSNYAYDAIKKVTKDMVNLSQDALKGIQYDEVYNGLTGAKRAETNVKFNTPQNANYQTGQSPVVIHLNIEKFNNQRPGDVQMLAQELDFYARNANFARGLT